mmetsp:Transcript_36661/g.63608  ORF Transcript_36661/g.63608 Transcript_36661/m.63608 type:complete len:332 (+) Transcript_36661:160-1155(+)
MNQLLVLALLAAQACMVQAGFTSYRYWVYNQADAINAGTNCGDYSGGEEACSPENWYAYAEDCAGESQSPINVVQASPSTTLSQLVLNKNNEDCDLLYLVDNYHTWKVDMSECDGSYTTTWNDVDYELVQFHFHSPSENTIGGGYFDAEMHLVHASAEGELLVIGVMFDVVDYGGNHFFSQFWNNTWSDDPDWYRVVSLESNLDPYTEILPATPSYYHWNGSLTTPPCSEGVTWILMSQPSSMSQTQLDMMRDGIASHTNTQVGPDGNFNRPVQALNGRDVLMYVPGFGDDDEDCDNDGLPCVDDADIAASLGFSIKAIAVGVAAVLAAVL